MSPRRRLRARDRRAIALGLILIAPFACYRVAIGPWLKYRGGLRDALTAERDVYAREQAAVNDLGRLRSEQEGLQDALAVADPWLLSGPSEVTIAGRLTRRVTEVGPVAGILIQDVVARDPGAGGGNLRAVSVGVRALGDLEGITRFLHDLENGEELLHVTELTIRAAGINDGDLERGQLMSAGMVVTGYWIGTAETNAQPSKGQGR